MSLPQDVIQQTVEAFVENMRAGGKPSVDDVCRQHNGDRELRTILQAAKMVEQAKVPPAGPESHGREAGTPPRLRGYRLLSRIGHGGMGIVYKAEDETLGRHVALKVISPTFLDKSGDATELVTRFEAEARIVANLQHSNIVQVYGFSEDQGVHYLSMQLIDGLPLSEILNQLCLILSPRQEPATSNRRLNTPETGTKTLDLTRTWFDGTHSLGRAESHDGGRSAPQSGGGSAPLELIGAMKSPHEPGYLHAVARIGIQVADALAYSHRKGVTHRDIKPGNLLLDSSGTVWVADFGLARLARPDTPSSSSVEGSLRYMAPEQFCGEVAARSDLYSLGVTLYELLTLRPAFEAASISELKTAIEEQDLAVPFELSGLSADLKAVIKKAMAPAIDKRYETAEDLRSDLERFLAGDPVLARKPAAFELAYRWCYRKPWQALAASLAVSVLVLFAMVAVNSSSAARTQTQLAAAAERGRERATKMQRLAETRQTQLQHQVVIQTQLQPYAARFALTVGRRSGALNNVPGDLRSWDTDRLRFLAQLRPRKLQVLTEGNWGILDAEVAGDGTCVASCDAGGLLVVWDTKSGRVRRRLAAGRWRDRPGRWSHHFLSRPEGTTMMEWGLCFVDLCWIDEGQRLAGASLDGTGVTFDVDSGEMQNVLSSPHPLYSVAASSDGNRLLFGDATGRVYLRALDGSVAKDLDVGAGAVTVITWREKTQDWIIGGENGLVQILSGKLLEKQSQIELDGPIWSLDVVEAEEHGLLAVGCQDSFVSLLELSEGGGRIEAAATLALPESSIAASAIHAVHFSNDGARIYAADDLGRVTQWDLSANKSIARWNIDAAARDPRTGELLKILHEQHASLPLPLPFQRAVSLLREAGGGQRMFTAGSDIAVKEWDIAKSSNDGVIRLTKSLGPNPQIAFDSGRSELLWALDQAGTLWALDTTADKVIDRRQAHSGDAVGISVARSGRFVATIGGDRRVRFWQLVDGKISPTGRKKIDHDQALISVTLSPDDELIAAVDAVGRLSVWSVESGQQVFLSDLVGKLKGEEMIVADRPFTGRVAFNSDGTLLSAFGSSQTAVVFSTNPFRRLNEQLFVAGNGGTAMIWSPVNPKVVIAADDYPRYVVRAFERDHRNLELVTWAANEPCVAMETSPDGRRIIMLEEGGRLVFLESEHLVQTLEMRNPRLLDSDLAMDREGVRLAIVGRNGAIDILETTKDKKRAAIDAVDDTRLWSARDVVDRSRFAIEADARAMVFDDQNRLNMLLTETGSSDFRNEGALQFVRVESDSIRRERIEVDGTVSDRRSVSRAVSIVDVPGEEPAIIFRRRTADVGAAYDGMVHMGRRVGPGDWQFETLLSHGNWGFYPVPQTSMAGKLTDLYHFSFATFTLMHSSPGETAGDDWKTEFVGHVGDGLDLYGERSDDGRMHFLFRTNPFNSAPTPSIYAWFDGQEIQREVIDARAAVGPMRLLPDGSPVVRLVREDPNNGNPDVYLVRRTKDGWTRYCDLPPGSPGSFVVGAEGKLFVGPWWDPQTKRLILWQRDEGAWKATQVAGAFKEGDPVWSILLKDNHGAPVILAGELGIPFSWLKLLRIR